MTHPYVHALIYGDAGAGKSTSAATFPKPALVFMFDPYSKETPYLTKGTVTDDWRQDGTHVQDVYAKDGNLLFSVEHYIDKQADKPEAYTRFLNRLVTLEADIKARGYQTVILDSTTFMELSARKLSQYVLNKTSREPRQWFAFSTDALEEILMIRFGSLPINVVVAAHISDDKDELHGFMVSNPALPGRMSKRAPAGYGELYHQYVKTDEKGERSYLWDTSPTGRWNASTQVGAPHPCPATYSAIWLPS